MKEDLSFLGMVDSLNAETVAHLQRAIEIGKFPDGRRLTREQVALCMQAVIAWEQKNLPENQRTGYIDKGEKEGDVCDSHDHSHDAEFEDTGVVKFKE